MKFVLDTHTHTIASGHAYSTIHDYIEVAKKKKLELVAFTDHGPAMPGGPNIFYIGNQRVIPREIDGIEILRGVEANIMDFEGNIDIPDFYLERLDLVLASLHDVCIQPGTREENTRAFIKVMNNRYVDIVAHPGNPRFPIDINEFVLAAKKNNKIIEINNSTFTNPGRSGSRDNCIMIARKAKEHGVFVVAGSDAHISFDVGSFQKSIEVFKLVEMPEELIMNTSKEKLKKYLKEKGKKLEEKAVGPIK
ncbi:phosphatase [Paramaledivibacter caminithermalis]|jgi:putative hydrolase|uniref:Putative hydrolase n=1 Tax=Paramaledivibacter caminithermalis (strain DSM 15212 / CIP 107654 / DViRD3) TaxID=1121301 RepID=A0A1M6M018_PARC5|nr:phosphatase [Paramaledivibacter caminithermalis]SHJ76784.1 putative hydrolase [Paramaledivibacter caminithermalis DSM 15212]